MLFGQFVDQLVGGEALSPLDDRLDGWLVYADLRQRPSANRGERARALHDRVVGQGKGEQTLLPRLAFDHGCGFNELLIHLETAQIGDEGVADFIDGSRRTRRVGIGDAEEVETAVATVQRRTDRTLANRDRVIAAELARRHNEYG